MIAEKIDISLDEAIAHYEAMHACMKLNGDACPAHDQIATFLRRLRRYEEALKAGELVWKEDLPVRTCDTCRYVLQLGNVGGVCSICTRGSRWEVGLFPCP